MNLPFKPYASVATAILLFGKTGSTESVWFYRLENDGFNNDSVKSEREGDEIPELISLWNKRLTSDYSPQKMKHKFVNRADIVDNDYDLCERVYLSGYKYPEGVPLVHLDELFDIQKGNFGAAQADGGEFPFVTTSEELKRHSKWTFDCEAICVPTVSATGHGHASIKRIHYVSGKFSAATITAVMVKKPNLELYVPYVYYYLLAHKDELLVPLMRGSANVSLNEKRLGRLRIPVPSDIEIQKKLVSELINTQQSIESLKQDLDSANNNFEKHFIELKNSF